MRIVILTGGELRHTFLRKALGLCQGVIVLRSYCEGLEKSLQHLIAAADGGNTVRRDHLHAREKSESDFFSLFTALAPDRSYPQSIAKGDINDPRHTQDIEELAPDLLVCYGTSIIRNPMLSRYQGRFLNLHLGLSPYYRGTGTNFWPLVEGEPEFVGATFMHIDSGIDTGEIIHQIRARMFPDDTIHQIGNRLISDAALVYADIIRKFANLPQMPQPNPPANVRVFRKKDFSEAATSKMYRAFETGMIDRYLNEKYERDLRAPIVENSIIESVDKLRSDAAR
jgi:phosphoribosylglycinamide formyltransferase-1